MTLYPHMYLNVNGNLLKKNFSIQEWPLYSECFFMFGAILKATNSSFKKGMTVCRNIYVKKVMKLLAFIFEQPSYIKQVNCLHSCYDIWHVLLKITTKCVILFKVPLIV